MGDTVIWTEHNRRIPVENLPFLFTSLFFTLFWLLTGPAQSVAQGLVQTVYQWQYDWARHWPRPKLYAELGECLYFNVTALGKYH